MPECNRVTPYGEIVRSPLRGRFLGNRGCIHRERRIVRPWATRRWIVCALEYKGWKAPQWLPGRWTPLFFYDEALALAAGHRPCALCRRDAYDRYRAAIGIRRADDIDLQLHAERAQGRAKRTHRLPWRDLPDGAYAERDGVPCAVDGDALRPWSADRGYLEPVARPREGDATVLTPPLSVAAMINGYPVALE